MNRQICTFLVISAAPCLMAQDVANLDFNFAHGTLISDQYAASSGITIDVNGGQNVGIVYDSELGGENGASIDGADNDLERLSSVGNASGWDGGNLGTDFIAGGLLIIQENAAQSSAPTYGSGENLITSASNYDPDDNVSGGTITFNIDTDNFDYRFFNVTLADFEEDGVNYSTTLFGIDGSVETFAFSDFTDPNNERFDASIVGGDNFINTLPEIALSTGVQLSRVDISFINSSGSVSNIIFSEDTIAVPEPASTAVLALGGLAFFIRRQR